jgi:hypothetical protein
MPLKNSVFAGLICISILLCALASPAPLGAAAPDSTRAATKPQPALWAQAVKVFEANKDLVPGKMLQKIQELDDGGRVKSESNAEVTLALDKAGKVKSEILKASKDGKDVTAEERKKAEERSKKEAAREKKKEAEKSAKKGSGSDSDEDSKERSHSFSSGDNPFNPEIQSDVRITETNARETIGDRSCERFGYAYPAKSDKPSKGKPATVKGSVWLEEGTGNPVKVEFTQDPLPRGAKSMLTTLHYGSDGNGSWILQRMEFEASGSFLFIKKRIRGDLAFSDYWKYVEPSTQK